VAWPIVTLCIISGEKWSLKGPMGVSVSEPGMLVRSLLSRLHPSSHSFLCMPHPGRLQGTGFLLLPIPGQELSPAEGKGPQRASFLANPIPADTM
jgi:hypothetical protein